MIKTLIATALLTVGFTASAIEVKSCEEANATLNQVVEMRTYANGSVKLFTMDQIEPAAASYGIAVTVDRGDDLSNFESFCRYVWGLSGADLKLARSSYDKSTALLTVTIPVRSYSDSTGDFVPGTLTVVINKGAADEAGLVSAKLK